MSNKDSSIKIGNQNRFKGDVAIGENAKVIKNSYVVDKSINYEIGMEDIRNIETLSIYLTQNFGENKLTISGVISLIAGVLSILTYLNSSVTNIDIFSWLPKVSSSLGTSLLVVGILLFALGSVLLNAIRYKQHAKCKNCGRDFAYKPYKDSTVKEIEVRDGTRRAVTNYYECRFCNDKVEKKQHDFISYESNN